MDFTFLTSKVSQIGRGLAEIKWYGPGCGLTNRCLQRACSDVPIRRRSDHRMEKSASVMRWFMDVLDQVVVLDDLLDLAVWMALHR